MAASNSTLSPALDLVRLLTLRPFWVSGRPTVVGELVDVPPELAASIIGTRRAEIVDAAQWVAIRDAVNAETQRFERASRGARQAGRWS